MRIASNHWGWTPRGVAMWLRWAWAWPFEMWGVEITGSHPRTFVRRCKIGPVCFAWGTYPTEKGGA